MIDPKIYKSYMPMTETAFYILFSLLEKRHGYGIMQYVETLTNNRISLGAGTLYGSLSKMEKDKLIVFVDEVNKRKSYLITDIGKEILVKELKRIEEQYNNTLAVKDVLFKTLNKGDL